MAAIFPFNGALIDKLDIDLVDQSGGMERVICPFVPELVAGLQPEFSINGADQIFGRFLLAGTPGAKHGSDLFLSEG
jgi:hypothetical protein